jgi:subtilisin
LEVIMPAKKSALRRYIIMSPEGFLGDTLTAPVLRPSNNMVSIAARSTPEIAAPEMKVLDSLHENGPKLVEMPAEGELSLRLSRPGLKIVPEVFYHRQWERFRVHAPPPAKAKKAAAKKTAKATKSRSRMKVATLAVAASGVSVSVTDASNGAALKGAHIVAFTDFAARQGAEADTGANGRATLNGLSPGAALERVYIYAPAGYWGFFASNTKGSAIASVKLTPINVKDPTLLLTTLYGSLPADAGDGVTVGIVDSGVDKNHPDLPNVVGGLNCVSDEVRNNPAAANNWGPAKKEGEHGTHVAGIVGGHGAASGFRGVAPGVKLRSYRVFPDKGGGASNFDIARAIDQAVLDKCDVINMSLGGGPKDDLTHASINRALDAGAVVIVAAGNDGRQPVAFPAAFTECVAISAMGRVGSFPKGAIGTSSVMAPMGSPNTKEFVADFSNIGTEIDVIGAGVEIVSTLPGTGHGSMSGTSMACPAVAGFTAFLLGSDAALQQKVGAARSRAVKDALYAACKPQGFGRNFEGFGLPT